MTALAMIIGMLPMAFALGEGGEQNAPLGRAVIGGLLVRDAHHAVLRPDYLHAASKKGAGGYGSPDRRRSRRDSQAMNDKEADHMHRGSWRKLLALVVILGAAAAVYFLGYLPRERTTKQLDAAAATRRITPPLVNAAVVKRAPRAPN
jgi:hypothetical protein